MARSGQTTNEQPYSKTQVLTKSDATVYDPPLDALYVGGTGHINIVDASGATTLISAVPAGALLPIKVKQLLSTSTTATLVVGLQW